MYIKSIVLDGFKSYGQRTEITGFDSMFNAITGLNGSGKSNILDSICFVLGISNLTHVRANSLQDLIYKSGQAGVNKATVSITFDNRNNTQCPSGYENIDEIVITRQIAIGGKNKYMINGTNVTSKKIQDLFCSIQLNVNNPHFLIMQGRITKVLNMKPPEILSMVEEAAGTRMYEVKKQATQKLIERKDAKLLEFQAVIREELQPKLDKLKAEREHFLEFQRTERELEHLMGLYQVWQYFEAKRNLMKAEKALEDGENKVRSMEGQIEQNRVTIQELEGEIENITSNNQSEFSKELYELEVQLKAKEKHETTINSSVKSIKENISVEGKKKAQLEKRVVSDEKALETQQNQLNKVQSLFETLKENDKRDSEAFSLAERKYEAVCTGMEVNDQGESETLLEQLMNTKEEASKASTESKQASMELVFCQNKLKEMQKQATANSSDYEKDKSDMDKTEKEVTQLESSMAKLNYSETRMADLQEHIRTLNVEVRNLRDSVENFEASKPYTSCKYRDPEPNFNRSRVKGVVCKLINLKDNRYATALETAAGGKLFNVVVDTDDTSRKLLQKGDLQTRTTFIPLNKISSSSMDQNTIRLAQNLVGEENCMPALSLINYDKSLSAAMQYVFGNVFICKDINVAKKVTFHDRIRKRCVTLDGDSTDPSGTLSGGARQKGESILKQLQQIIKLENELRIKEEELTQITNEMRQLSGTQEQYNSLKYKLEIAKHQLKLINHRLMNTTFARQKEELDTLKKQIADLQVKVKTSQETEKQCLAKVKDLENKMKDATGYQERRLKEAEAEMKKAKSQADKSKKEWAQREQEYRTLTLEIEELTKTVKTTKEEIISTEESIAKMQEEYDQILEKLDEAKKDVSECQSEVKRLKSIITEKNKEVQGKIKKKDQLAAQIVELELQIKKYSHELKDLKSACKNSKFREQEYAKKIGNNDYNKEKGESLTPKEGEDLERRIKLLQEKTHKLGRTVNAQAQNMFSVEEKRFEDILKKQKIVQVDRAKLVKLIAQLDGKKENALKLAHEQVSKDFGSIFSTLLPGANGRLVPTLGKTILQGLEIKVSLGNVWKDSLTELSGGQRSLAALSLILAMLLFKPAPLYILDEVDAALDLSHTQNIGSMLRSHFKKSQFIVVSLKDGMFNNANVLFRTKFLDGVSTIQRTENTKKG
ncbi:structural maintenance of chromosomes protein 2 [Sitophilus oryzae]|uniref:Structural maintenance of chromosomes protein n=1 Tax=Sitophilus oryzae TaxID=7048 RepID=A0A6J2YG70_SITOR|nr:structural maintenance of chromosomes protein 2 [Sitophilus oryzae]